MKRQRYSVEQIVAAVKQHELGTPVADLSLDKLMLQAIASKKW